MVLSDWSSRAVEYPSSWKKQVNSNDSSMNTIEISMEDNSCQMYTYNEKETQTEEGHVQQGDWQTHVPNNLDLNSLGNRMLLELNKKSCAFDGR